MIRDISVAALELVLNAYDAGATLVHVALKTRGNEAALTVKDNGVGMTSYILERAVEKGFSGKGSEGMGLYSISLGAAACGGALDISSEVGKGADVKVEYRDGFKIGDIASTVAALIDDKRDLTLDVEIDGDAYELDTRELKEALAGGSVEEASVIASVKRGIMKSLKIYKGAML